LQLSLAIRVQLRSVNINCNDPTCLCNGAASLLTLLFK
jgi:hypothetical protein